MHYSTARVMGPWMAATTRRPRPLPGARPAQMAAFRRPAFRGRLQRTALRPARWACQDLACPGWRCRWSGAVEHTRLAWFRLLAVLGLLVVHGYMGLHRWPALGVRGGGGPPARSQAIGSRNTMAPGRLPGTAWPPTTFLGLFPQGASPCCATPFACYFSP
jgi:hypothetical protein